MSCGNGGVSPRIALRGEIQCREESAAMRWSSSDKGILFLVLRSVFPVLLVSFLWSGCSRSSPESQSTGNLTPKTVMLASPKLLELGKTTFERNCAPCHGLQGDGQGPAAYLLYPKPRNFVAARYRLVSTWDFAPADEDIFRTISRGMPGSAMPSWAHLTEETRWALAHYLKAFAKNPFEIRSDHQPQNPAGVL